MSRRRRPTSDNTSLWQRVTSETIVHPTTGEPFSFISRQPLSAVATPAILARGDIGALVRLGLYSAATRCIPPRHWTTIAAAVPQRRKRSFRRRIEAAMRAFFGATRSSAELAAISADYRNAEARRLMVTATESIESWQPELSIAHPDRLEAAMQRRRGAILWCDSFLFESLLGKRALFEAGFAGHQVSVTEHGYSRSRLGRVAINSLQQRQETRYLASRLAFEPADSAVMGRRMLAVLRQKGLVLVTNNVYSGRRIVSMPFGANARLRLATGPLRLAQLVQAPLMPFALFEVEPFRRYEAVVGEEIPVAGNASADDRHNPNALIDALVSYRSWLETHLLRHPEQWMRWPTITPSGDDDIP